MRMDGRTRARPGNALTRRAELVRLWAHDVHNDLDAESDDDEEFFDDDEDAKRDDPYRGSDGALNDGEDRKRSSRRASTSRRKAGNRGSTIAGMLVPNMEGKQASQNGAVFLASGPVGGAAFVRGGVLPSGGAAFTAGGRRKNACFAADPFRRRRARERHRARALGPCQVGRRQRAVRPARQRRGGGVDSDDARGARAERRRPRLQPAHLGDERAPARVARHRARAGRRGVAQCCCSEERARSSRAVSSRTHLELACGRVAVAKFRDGVCCTRIAPRAGGRTALRQRASRQEYPSKR